MKWWQILITIAVGVGIALWWRRNPLEQIAREFKSIDQAAEAKKVEATRGATIARAKVEADHAETIRKFDEVQKARAETLRSDPAALARWLARLSK